MLGCHRCRVVRSLLEMEIVVAEYGVVGIGVEESVAEEHVAEESVGRDGRRGGVFVPPLRARGTCC